MKSVLLWLFAAAIAFGVYKCIDNNGNSNVNELSDEESVTAISVDNSSLATIVVDSSGYASKMEKLKLLSAKKKKEIAAIKKSTVKPDENACKANTDNLNQYINSLTSYLPLEMNELVTLSSLTLNDKILTVRYIVNERIYNGTDYNITGNLLITKIFPADEDGDELFGVIRREITESGTEIRVIIVSSFDSDKTKTFTYGSDELRSLFSK